ncbi:MAG TPA: ATP-dependent zinc metalloprotease FtsH [Ktedonobacterales bacterium]|jgi:cell division protease FtsH
MNIIPSQVYRAKQVRGPNGGPNSDGPNRPTDPTNPFGGPNRPGPNPNGQPPRGGRWLVWRWLLVIVVGLILWQVATLVFTGTGTAGACAVSYGTFYQQLEDGQVKSVTIQSDQASGDFRQAVKCSDGTTNTKFQTTIPTDDQTLMTTLNQQAAKQTLDYTVKSSSDGNLWLSILINVVPWLLFIGLIFLLIRRAGAGQQNVFNFGKSRAKLIMEDRPSTTFADVAGVDEAKYELQEVVEFLKTPGKFQRLGGKIPKGVLLVGPPGTGKTLLARAVAGEAGVPFFSMSGSEFVEVLVGVGASRVRDLFDQAKKNAPCIIFIDEIDAVGRQRGTSLTTNDEREQTLNQLLVEMDGFDTHQAVVVVAATNRPDGLDQALLRPGRFDRRVTVDRPDWKGRRAILEIHSRGVPLASDVDLTQLSRTTTGMVGADLANLVNEAALLAARRNLDRVNMACFNEALDKIQLGAERPLVLSEEDLRVVAYHEGGHALVGLITPHSDPVTKVTIVPRGQALGVTQSTPLDDRYNYSKEYLRARIMMALGGRAAEDVALGSITTGAENDLQVVTGIARQMVMRWGMSEKIGTISYSDRSSPFGGIGNAEFGNREYSEETAKTIDEEVHILVEDAYTQVRALLTRYRPTLDRIAQELRRHEVIDNKQLMVILAETGVEIDTVSQEVWDLPDGDRIPRIPPASNTTSPLA